MPILGIDPGLRRTGWGVIESSGNSLRFVAAGHFDSGKGDLAQRLLKLQSELSVVVACYSPRACAIERTFVNCNPSSALALGHARGVLMAGLATCGHAVGEYSPNEIKKAVVGYGHATKDQIIKMLGLLLGQQDISSHDAADALAIAICHSVKARLQQPANSLGKGLPLAKGLRSPNDLPARARL